MIIIRQTDVQRRGGPCSKYPVSCVVRDLLGQAGLLRPFEPVRIIDLTYGQGIWWYALKGKAIVAGIDIRKLDWVVRPRWFKISLAQAWDNWIEEALKALGGRVDIIAVDPPWQECIRGNGCRGREIGGRYHYRASRAIGNPELILESARRLAGRLGAPLLYHFKHPLGGEHLAGPVAFRPFFYLLNPKAAEYRSYFGVIQP